MLGKVFAVSEQSYAKINPVGGKLITVKCGWLSNNHFFVNEATFEQMCIYLVIFDYLDKLSLNNLSTCNILFVHLCKMMRKMKLEHIYDLFKYNHNYAQ